MESQREKQILNWRWGYIILLCKFTVMAISSGTAKSFGVLIPEMVERLGGSYASLGLVCSLPSTFTMLSSPLMSFILASFNHRLAAMLGGTISAVSLAASGVVSNLPILGLCLAFSGIGRSCIYYALTISLKEYFPERFVVMNTLALYGLSVGVTFLPVITEGALEAYGYSGAFLILGGMTLHLAACGASIRKPVFKKISVPKGEHRQDELIQIEETKGKGEEDQMAETVLAERNAEIRKTDLHGEESQVQERVENCKLEENNSVVKRNPCITVDEGRIEKYTEAKFQEGKENRSWQTDEHHPLIRDSDDTDDDASKKDQAASERDDTCSFHSILETCRKSILKEPLHLFSLPVILFSSYATKSWILFLVPHAEQLGIAQSKAVFLSSVAGIGGFVGRTITVILLAKKVDIFSAYIVFGPICATMFFLDGVSETFAIRACLAFVQGLCFYVQDSSTTAMLKSLLVHESNFNFSLSLNCLVFGVGLTSAGFITGTLVDTIHSYTKVFFVIGCAEVSFFANVILIKVLLKRRNAKEI